MLLIKWKISGNRLDHSLVCSALTKHKEFVVVDCDTVGTSIVGHGCHGFPDVSGYAVSLHGVELPLAVITAHCVEVGVDRHHTCVVQKSKAIG